MINTYLKFCKDFKCQALNPSVKTILCYLEFLSRRLKSPKSISNYWSSVKLLHTLNRSPFKNIKDIDVDFMLKSITVTKRHVSEQKLPLTKAHIFQMCQILDKQNKYGLVIKTAILIGFYAFLRASNLCPKDTKSFDPTRNFTRGDVSVSQHGLTLRLKWTKTMQSSLQQTTIPIPIIKPSTVDPVDTFIKMCLQVPAQSHDPLFMLDPQTPLTIDKLRKAFLFLCQQININPSHYSLHSLRRGGATEAYDNGADPLQIQRHGSWASDAFLNYVAPGNDHTSSVCKALSH